MRLYLHGHDYKYAAEQMLLSLYPSERPEYSEGRPEGDRVELSLSRGASYVTASCKLVSGENVYHGRSAVRADSISDSISRDKLCSRIIKNAFYRAALSSVHAKPVWGALTGVRPGKLFCGLMESSGPDVALKRFISEYDVSTAGRAARG